MRCPHCGEPNPEGVALCLNCASPLTPYAGHITGAVSEATRAKAARLRIPSGIVPVMAAFDVLLAVAGPFRIGLAGFFARPEVNPEGMDYMARAFGAVGAFVTAGIMIPVGIVLLIVAWATWTQRTWAWGANLGVLALVGIMAISGFISPALVRVIVLGFVIVLTMFWSGRTAREWYGAVD